MSEDIPERTLISEAERKRLKREKETPEERPIRKSEVSSASISGYYRFP